MPWDETVWLAREAVRAGAHAVSTGFGWHEAKVPTIAGVVPHAAFAEHIRRLKAAVSVSVTASNRINTPGLAGQALERSLADGLIAAGRSVRIVGGARCAKDLDAQRAIEEGTAAGCEI